jgi:hypothetical protein
MTPQTTDAAAREQVLTWLAGRLRFEQLLADLHADGGEVGQAVLAAAEREPAAAKAA